MQQKGSCRHIQYISWAQEKAGLEDCQAWLDLLTMELRAWLHIGVVKLRK